jgi:hypothetical protein
LFDTLAKGKAMNIYPYGYMAHEARIIQLMGEHPRLMLIDTRLTPWSKKPAWRAEALKTAYGERYRWAGASLGNLNYKHGGPIRLADPVAGLRGLRHWLQHGYDLLLLCGCADYTRCHLKTIVEALQAEMPAVEVILPEPGALEDRCKCLSIRQPWAWLLTHPEEVAACGLEPKIIENRAWKTHYRGPLLLHAGMTLDTACFDRHSGRLLPDSWRWKFGAAGARLAQMMPQRRGDYATGSLVGFAQLVDVVEHSFSPWFIGPYGFVLQHARALTAPIGYPGSRMLFDVPGLRVLGLDKEVSV